MLRTVCLITYVFSTISSFAQNPKSVTVNSQKPTSPKTVEPKILKDLRDSASYTAGIHIVNKYRSQNIYNFNSTAVAKACNDLQSNSQQLLSNSDADKAVLAYQTQLMANPKMTAKSPASGVVLNDIQATSAICCFAFTHPCRHPGLYYHRRLFFYGSPLYDNNCNYHCRI